MINASGLFKEKINNGEKCVNYAEMILRDGTTVHLTPSDFMIDGCTISDKTTSGKFGIGFTTGKTVKIHLANFDEKFSSYDFYKAVFYLYAGTKLDNGEVEKVRKGKYYVVSPSTPGNVISISGLDSMHLFDRAYNANTVYPATLLQILSDCCIDCGVNIGFGEFDNCNFYVNEKPKDCTYRQVVSWVAQIAGYNARISVNDALELVWYKTLDDGRKIYHGGNLTSQNNTEIIGGNFENYDSDLIIFGGDFSKYTDDDEKIIKNIKSLNVGTDDVVITGIKIESDNGTYIFGENGYLIDVSKNPLVNGKEEEIGRYLEDRMVGISFRPLTANITNNPLIEPIDVITVSDIKGNYYNTFINSVIYKINGYTEIACKAEDPIRNEGTYVNSYAEAVVEAKRNDKKELSAYDKAVQNMSMLAMNSMGFHSSYKDLEDGSRISYLHDKTTLEESKVIYKQTIDGFFVSQDGGKSYTSGFDSQGNAVFNVLSAIGILFDWAKGGTLTLGGDNDINGSIVVYDEEGKVIGSFNKEGLWASNGYFEGTIVSKNANITGGKINISTSSKDYDVLDLKYKTSSTKIRPAFIRLEEGSLHQIQITPDTLSIGGSYESVYLNEGNIVLKSGGKTSVISGESASFADYVSILGDLFVGGKIKGATFSSAVNIESTGSLELSGSASIKCNGNAEFNNGIKVGSVFSLDTVGNISTNGYIKATGNYESSLYSLEVRDKLVVKSGSELCGATYVKGASEFTENIKACKDLSVEGTTTLKGKCIICDGAYDTLGFFGGSGSIKKNVSTIYSTSSATVSSNASKINEIINALKDYNLL